MSVASVIIGTLLMVVGFFMAWKHHAFRQNVGDISVLFDTPKADWLDWPVLGVIFMVIGLFLATGLFEAFFLKTFGFFIAPSV